jgi:hypothetical protein
LKTGTGVTGGIRASLAGKQMLTQWLNHQKPTLFRDA